MKEMDVVSAQKILENLKKQEKSMEKVLDLQKSIRNSVNERDWTGLETSLQRINAESEIFKEENSLFYSFIEELELDSVGEFYLCARHYSKKDEKVSEQIILTFNSVKRMLLQSKVENKALNDYVKIANAFLQKVYEKASPNRVVRYSRRGAIITNKPASLVFDTVM